MELKEGYKQTDVGVIPEDWEVLSLGEVCQVIGGGTPSTSVPDYWGDEINWFTPSEVGSMKFLQGSKRKITSQGLHSSGAKLLPKGTILLTTRASIGEVGILTEDSTTNQGFQSLVPCDVNGGFLYYLAATLKSEFLERASGSTFLEISPSNVKAVKAAMPPFEEQQAIAEVLSDVDAEIESLARRYEKLVNRKQGLSEELLSGRTRLVEPKSKGFKQTDVGVIPEDWEIKQIKEVASLSSGGTPSRSRTEYFDGTIPWLSISDISRSDKFIYTTAEQITEEALLSSSARDFPLGTIMLAMYASIGKVAISTGRISCSQAILGIVPNPMIARDYFYYFLLNHQAKFLSLGQQGTQSNLNKAIVSETRIPLPSIIEQQAIAEVLSDVDAEIQAVAKMKAKVQAKKKGLMQTLLTGKIRLI